MIPQPQRFQPADHRPAMAPLIRNCPSSPTLARSLPASCRHNRAGVVGPNRRIAEPNAAKEALAHQIIGALENLIGRVRTDNSPLIISWGSPSNQEPRFACLTKLHPRNSYILSNRAGLAGGTNWLLDRMEAAGSFQRTDPEGSLPRPLDKAPNQIDIIFVREESRLISDKRHFSE